MDIYCGVCNNNIGLQTNEEFSEMYLRNQELEQLVREAKGLEESYCHCTGVQCALCEWLSKAESLLSPPVQTNEEIVERVENAKKNKDSLPLVGGRE